MRKPRYACTSSLTDKLRILDSIYYPHIIDTIFDNAPLAALIAMRVANKAWREKADRRLAYHLVLKGNSTPIEVHAGLVGERFMTITEDNLEQAKTLKPSWAKFVRIVDLDATSCHKDVCRLLSAWKVDESYETLRYVEGAPVFDKYSKLNKQPRRVVFLRSYTLTGHFGDDSRKAMNRLVYSQRFIGKPGREGGAVVLHQSQAAAYMPEFHFDPEALTQSFRSYRVVVVFHGWQEPITGPDEVAGNIKNAFRGNLGHTYKLIQHNIRTRMPLIPGDTINDNTITVVGMETLSPAAVGLTEDALDGKTLKQAFQELLQKSWDEIHGHLTEDDEESNMDSESDGTDEEALDSSYRAYRKALRKHTPIQLTFKTHAEYRASRNQSEYEIETSPVLSVRRTFWGIRKPVRERPPPHRRYSM